jgi:hypothetical protein
MRIEEILEYLRLVQIGFGGFRVGPTVFEAG